MIVHKSSVLTGFILLSVLCAAPSVHASLPSDAHSLLSSGNEAPTAMPAAEAPLASNTKNPLQAPEERVLRGRVVDELNEPLIGATVKLKDTSSGVLADIDGNFIIPNVPDGATLVVSYMGYTTQEIAIGNRQTINVQLKPATKYIQEVVVTAMGILRKEKSLTYATQQVKAEDLMKVQEVNVANSLEGKIAGLTATASTGGAGGATRIQLRGNKSILAGSSPLIVVDGIPMSNSTRDQIGDATTITEYGSAEGADALSQINPDDIESINVLKGANAAALYGSRAANGVIMITTKKGKAGKMSVSYTGNLTFDKPLLLPKIQSTYGAAVDANGYLGEANGWGGRIANSPTTAKARATEKFPTERDIHLRNTPGGDLSDFYRTGVTTNNSVAVSGGTEKVQSYLSVANSHALGLIENNDYNRNTVAFRQTYKLWDRVTLNASINYLQTKTRNRVGGGTVMNPLFHYYTTPRNIDMDYYRDNYAVDGSWVSYPVGHYVQTASGFVRQNDTATLNGPMMNWPYLDARQNNPYWLMHQNYSKNRDDRVYGGFQGTVDIIDGLSFQARLNFDHDRYSNEGARYATTFNANNMYDYGTYYKGRNTTTELYVDYLLSYNKNFAQTWDVSATAGWVGHTVKGDRYSTYVGNATAYDGLLQQVPTEVNRFDVSAGSFGTTGESKSSNWDKALLATAQLGWKERVYVDVSYRLDWYRTFRQFRNFGTKEQYGYLGFGANALVHELVKLPEWWNYAKFRIAYSTVGNAVPNTYFNSAYANVTAGTISATGKTLFISAEPEKTGSFETGVELLFLDNRLSLDLTYYNAEVKNLYMNIRNSSGLTVPENSAHLRNQGLEASLGYNFRFNRDWRWRTAVNFAYNDNKILSVGNDEAGRKKKFDINFASVKVRFTEGDSYGDMYVRDLRRNADGTIFLSSNGNIMKEQRYTQYVGNMNSPYQLGWSNTINYKDFQLFFLINGRMGGKVISLTEAYLDYMGLSERTAEAREYAEANNLYTSDGQPAMYLPDGSGNLIGVRNYYQIVGARNSEYAPNYVYSATNFRLRELSLSYTFHDLFGPDKNLSLSFIGRNLFFFYKDAPVDPDVSISTGNGLGGFEYFSMPSTRSYGFNVKLTF